jgi:hypothetical protein
VFKCRLCFLVENKVVKGFRLAARVFKLIIQVVIFIIILFKVLIGGLKSKKIVECGLRKVKF